MPILLKCTCGKSLHTPDELAGKKVRCPGCLLVLDVPVPILSPDPLPRPKPPPLLPAVVESVEDQDLLVALPAKPARQENADTYALVDVPEAPRRLELIKEVEPLRKLSSKARSRENNGGGTGGFMGGFSTDPSIAGGITGMLATVVLFILPMSFPRIFSYRLCIMAAIAFVLSLIAFIRGLAKKGINAGISGGGAMMLLAIIWFISGLLFGNLFIYPPVLFIIGLLAFIIGAVKNNS